MPSADAFPETTLVSLELPTLLAELAGHCTTAGGARALRALRPGGGDEQVAARRLRGVEALAAVQAEQAPGLGGCADLPHVLEDAGKRILEGPELSLVIGSLDRLIELRRWADSRPAYPSLRQWIHEAPTLTPLAAELRKSIDPRGQIRDEADPALPRLRQLIQQIGKERGRRIDEIAQRLHQRGVLRQPQPVARGDRLLLAVRSGHAGRTSGAVHDRSQSGDTLYVEPTAVLELSNRLVEARSRERSVVEQVLRRCTRAVLAEAEALRATADRLDGVDIALAAAHWAIERRAHYAETDAAGLRLVEARHPLLVAQMGHAQVVPVDLELGEDHDLMVVTGPNTGGKTMVLCTVGLLTALANCGLPLTAAAGSCVPLLAGLDADIGDPQSREDSLSTFSGHLARILRILGNAGPGRLVLLDELGTGTDPEEGAALGQAVLEELLARGAWVIANTHLGALKLFSLDRPRAENASMEFDPESLEPRFRLLFGVPGASHAVEVAERLGLPENILVRARELATRDDRTEQLLADVGRVRREAERLRERAGAQDRASQERVRELEAQERSSRIRRGLREKEAEQAYLQQMRTLGKVLDDAGEALIARLRGTDKERATLLITELRHRLGSHALQERWNEFIRKLKKGDHVWVPELRERLQVLKVDRKRERVKLRHGAMEMELPLREITWAAPEGGA